MSRTEGVHLPRIPTSHTRVTSSRAMRHHVAASSALRTTETRRRSLSEPSYTAYVGSPRQDIPHPVFSNAAMYDDVFDKEGRLLSGRNTAKFTSPLQTVGYNSLNDPHCRKLFLNNRRLRSHLINLGLITDDLKVVATTKEQRQKIRAHELLERKEMLAEKLHQREQERLKRLCQPSSHLPRLYQDSIVRHQERREQWTKVQELKTKKIIKQQEQERIERARKLRQKKVELERAIDEARLQEQAQRNALRVQQQMAEVRAYEKAYGKTAHWHREADKINNRMVAMKLQWAKKQSHPILSQSFPPPSLSSQTTQEDTKLHTLLPKLKEGEKSTSPLVPKNDAGSLREEEEERVREEEGARERESEGKGEKEMNKQEQEVPKSEVAKEETEKEVISNKEDINQTPSKARTDDHDDEEVTKGPSPSRSPPPPASIPASTASGSELLVQQSVLEGDQAREELTKILVDALHSVEGESSGGYMTVEDFLQVLTSPDLGLQLEDNEQLFLASQIDPENGGVVVYAEAASLVPNLLLHIYTQRAQLSMEYYGYNVEEEWVQLYPVAGGVVYLNKLTGTIQRIRPDEYRPFLKDEVFEDSLVDFFETADTDKDGLINYADFYNLLASPQVASRVYREQMEQLLGLYETQTVETEGRMDLASFPAVANPLLLMIYQNAYPDVEEWIELDSKKFGSFWLHKITGEIVLQQSSEVGGGGREGRSEETQRTRKKSKSKKKKKHSKKMETEEAIAPESNTTAQLSDQLEEGESSNLQPTNQELPTSSPSIREETIMNSESVEKRKEEKEGEEQEVVKPVSSRSRLMIPSVFETIPEEDETALDDSIATQTIITTQRERERDNEGKSSAIEEEDEEKGREDK